MKQTGSKAISMDGGTYGWEDVEERAKQLGFKMISRYIQYLVAKDLKPKRINGTFLVISLLLILVVMLQILMFITR